MRRAADPPTDDPPCKGVDDKGDIIEAARGRDIGEIADPQAVWRRHTEVPVHLVHRAWCACFGNGRADLLAPNSTRQAHLPHQAFDRAAGNSNAFAVQLPPDLGCAIDAEVILPDPPDL